MGTERTARMWVKAQVLATWAQNGEAMVSLKELSKRMLQPSREKAEFPSFVSRSMVDVVSKAVSKNFRCKYGHGPLPPIFPINRETPDTLILLLDRIRIIIMQDPFSLFL